MDNQDKNSSHPNPFHPDGPLFKEGEEIVNLIKQGKLISPAASPNLTNHKTNSTEQTDSPQSKKKDKNKSSKKDLKEIEVNKTIITNKEASYAEQVNLPEDNDKKKKDSLCCTIQ